MQINYSEYQMNMHYFNVVVHGQVCYCMVVWNSHSGVFRQYGTCTGTPRETVSSIICSSSASHLNSAFKKQLTQILIELIQYFVKDNAVLKAL